MNERNSIEAIDKINLTNQTKFGLDKISKIENYFIEDINQRVKNQRVENHAVKK